MKPRLERRQRQFLGIWFVSDIWCPLIPPVVFSLLLKIMRGWPSRFLDAVFIPVLLSLPPEQPPYFISNILTVLSFIPNFVIPLILKPLLGLIRDQLPTSLVYKFSGPILGRLNWFVFLETMLLPRILI